MSLSHTCIDLNLPFDKRFHVRAYIIIPTKKIYLYQNKGFYWETFKILNVYSFDSESLQFKVQRRVCPLSITSVHNTIDKMISPEYDLKSQMSESLQLLWRSTVRRCIRGTEGFDVLGLKEVLRFWHKRSEYVDSHELICIRFSNPLFWPFPLITPDWENPQCKKTGKRWRKKKDGVWISVTNLKVVGKTWYSSGNSYLNR